METTMENKLTLTEQALYCAQLMQWAVLSSDKNLSIFVDYLAHINCIDIIIYKNGWDNAPKNEQGHKKHDLKIDMLYVDELTPSKIKTIQNEIAKVLNDVVY